jgi:hypothetical protein
MINKRELEQAQWDLRCEREKRELEIFEANINLAIAQIELKLLLEKSK